MSKKPPHTKSIVALGFILIATLTIIGIILIYNELLKFSEATVPSGGEKKELMIIGNTLVSLYKLEGTTSLASALNLNKTKSEYDSLMNIIQTQIDTLKAISPKSENAHLDSVSNLLELKHQNTWKMLALLDSVERKSIRDTIKTTVMSKKDLSDLDKLMRNTSQYLQDTSIIKTEKKGLVKRIKNVFNSQDDSAMHIVKSQMQLVDSVIIPTLKDTVTQYINEIVLFKEKKNLEFIRRLVARQHILNKTNDRITGQINQIMKQLERREYEKAINLLKEKEATLKHSNQIVTIIGISASFLTLLFLTLSLRSLNKNQKYRKELEDSQKTTKKLLNEREKLMLSITHDIKAPLTSIIGYLELLGKSKLPQKENYYLANMQNSAEHVLELVKNLLDFHVLESNLQPIRTMPFSPGMLLSDIYQSFLPIAKKEQLNLIEENKINKNDVNYISDPYRIRQVVNNLLSNAIKFTPIEGTILCSSSISGNKLRISIKNSGPEISQEDISIIFEEFVRLKNTPKNKPDEGTGLGLPITKKIVRLLNGNIEVNSSAAEGTEFIVTIPLVKSGTVQTPPPSHEKEQLTTPANLKILFVDDDLVQLNLFAEMMKREGVTPTICNNPLNALELLQVEHFDIVFTDIQMPGMNGFELVERIRMASFIDHKDLPVIALSGNSGMNKDDFRDAGFTDFLPKPFNTLQLISMIQAYSGNEIENKPETVCNSNTKGFSALSSFAGDDIQAGSDIIQSFIDENTRNLIVIKEALLKKDYETIQKVSHKMLPLMRMISAQDVVNILSAFEKGDIDEKRVETLTGLVEFQLKEAKDFLSFLKSK